MEPDQVEMLKQNVAGIIDECKRLDKADNSLDIFMYLNDIIIKVGDLAHDIDPANCKKIEKMVTAIEAGEFD